MANRPEDDDPDSNLFDVPLGDFYDFLLNKGGKSLRQILEGSSFTSDQKRTFLEKVETSLLLFWSFLSPLIRSKTEQVTAEVQKLRSEIGDQEANTVSPAASEFNYTAQDYKAISPAMRLYTDFLQGKGGKDMGQLLDEYELSLQQRRLLLDTADLLLVIGDRIMTLREKQEHIANLRELRRKLREGESDPSAD